MIKVSTGVQGMNALKGVCTKGQKYKNVQEIETSITEKQLNEKMFSTRSFNETPSAHGRRPAVFWSQSVLQLQGSPSAAQTTRER